ncbi:pregnancy zone protein [Plutella xylostella]|uniref:pregnancy zone protein n=1 Tax=Plutella xylostella TaxID=51655 RepID=UPI0020331ABD|nr:pregnancy zone protein [Plutella xylostella]
MKCVYVLMLFVIVESKFTNNVSEPEDIQSYPCTDANHIFLSPGVLSAGGYSRACLSRFHTAGAATLTLTLAAGGQQTTAVRELVAGDGGCIDIAVPQLPNTKAELIVNVNYPSTPCTWQQRSSVRISSASVLLVSCERARCRRGGALRVRASALHADLTPRNAPIDEIYLQSPADATGERTVAARWRGVRTRLGLAQIQHRLDEQAASGTWTVTARLNDGTTASANFLVGDYEVPPFHLSVRHAPRVLRTSERLVWNVCVRYPWSEAVQGMLVIRLRGAARSGGVRTALRLRAPKACHRHAVAARRVGLQGVDPPDVVVADFAFQEDGTRIWQNTTVISQVIEERVALKFLTKYRTVVSPGLPYKLKIKATQWDGKPSANERLRICRTPSSQPSVVTEESSFKLHKVLPKNSTVGECDETVTDGRGVARIMFTVGENEVFPFYRFEATIANDSQIYAPPLYLPVKRAGLSHAAFGPLSGDSLTPGARVFVPLYLNLKNVSKAITVHFVVVTRGGTIHRWGATSQCPIANSGRARSASRDTDCNYFRTYDSYGSKPQQTDYFQRENSLYVPDPNAFRRPSRSDPENLLDRHLLRVMLPIRLTHQMCPDSHLLAYFYYNDELVSASKHIEIDECFANKAQLTWKSRQASPGSFTTLQVSTQGPSLCALTALDTASKWVQPDIQGVREVLMTEVNKLMDANRNMTVYDATGDCFMTDDNPGLPTNSRDITIASLASAGLRWVGAETPMQRSCDAPSPLTTGQYGDLKPRSDFQEAWLWKLVGVSGNGSALVSARLPDSITRHEATAYCLSRGGVAVSPPAVLQVFREFFIHADGPKRLRKGDTTFIKYRIFNYLHEPLSVQIHVLPDPHMSLLSLPVVSACLAPRASVAPRAELQARVAGQGRVSVRAVEVRGGCGGNESSSDRELVSDEVIIKVNIEHEGVPKQEHRSSLLCARGSSDSPSKVTWSWPGADVVPGSESMVVWAVGDATKTLLSDADSLVTLPRGCGEQNMARLATNLLALSRLEPHTTAAALARDHVSRGLARQLQYSHPSGGFSAFGVSDGTPSTWLTAFCIRYLRRAYQVISPRSRVPQDVERSERWLLNQQMENGCFRNQGQVFHRELKGGVGEEGEIASVALTAYVITSLVEGGVTIPSKVLANSLACLRALPATKNNVSSRIYAQALLAYTFVTLKKYEEDLRKTNDASLLQDRQETVAGLLKDEESAVMMQLLRSATRRDDFVWWETGSLSTSIEATSYFILATSRWAGGRAAQWEARAAARWLHSHVGSRGGMTNTQDTLIALEALTAISSFLPIPAANLTLTVICGATVLSETLTEAAGVPVTLKMKVCDEVKVGVEGSGCALVQATRSYNSLSAAPTSGRLAVQLSVRTDGPFDCDNNSTFCFCAAVVEACVLWTGPFPEMALLEVALPGGFGADAARVYALMQDRHTLLRRIEMPPNGGRVTFYLASTDGSAAITGSGGHQCYSLHAVGPRARTKPAYARVMDYYNADVNDTQIYTIPEECPPRYPLEKKPDTGSDNIFNNARSLNGDPIIDEDFFEEPIDAPLEDPLYDNLATDSHMGDKYRSIVLEKYSQQEKAGTEADFPSNKYTDSRYNSNEKIVENEILNRSDAHEFGTFKNGTDPNVASELKSQDVKEVTVETVLENPNLLHFHVVDSEKDLEVPDGDNGPAPSFALPPEGFVVPPPTMSRPSYPPPEDYSIPKMFRPRPHFYYEYPLTRSRQPPAG